jgi:AraC family transcriptional regulator
MTATEWRSGGAATWSKRRLAVSNPGQADRKPCKEPADVDTHAGLGGDSDPPTSKEDSMSVNVKTLPRYRVAYMRYIGPYGGSGGVPQLWQRLQRWAMARDLWTDDRLCLGIAHDHPAVTDPDKCRYDAGIVIPADLAADSQVNVIDFPGGKFALAPFEGTGQEIGGCWERVFSEWFPGSGYQPDDGPFVELYRGDFFDEKTGVVRCDLCTPVRPL